MAMGLFGPSVDDMIKSRDIPGLWKKMKHKNDRWKTLLPLADELWDHASRLGVKERGEAGRDALWFACFLCMNHRPYAGTGPVTPAEYQGSIGKALFGDKPPEEAFCPACGQYLSESPVAGEVGMYSQCAGCGRYCHRECAAVKGRCPKCGGSHWKIQLRG
jgi:hypothetical protein